MKQCPTCNRTYGDDTITFCLADGALLSASYDSAATQRIPARLTNPPPTEVLTAQPPPTEVLPQYLPPPQQQPVPANASAKYLLVGVIVLLVGGGILALVLLNQKNSSASSSLHSANAVGNTSANANAKPTETRAPTDYLRTPWLGLEVWQDGKADGLFKVDSYSTRVVMSRAPFELRVPRAKDETPVLVAASTNRSIFDQLKRGEKLDINAESFFNPYKAMADTRAGSATLMLNDDAHYVYDEERLKPISDSLNTIFVSSILSDGAEQSITSQKDDIYLVIFRDLDKSETVDNGEYEFLILDF